MTVPAWVVLGFAAWTIIHLLTTVGLYRWSRILTGRTEMKEFRPDNIAGGRLVAHGSRQIQCFLCSTGVYALDGSHHCPESTLIITLLLVFRQPKANLMILAVSAFSLLEYSFLWHQSGASALSYGGLWNE